MNFYGNRDLMVVLRSDHADAEWLYAETEWLNQTLNSVEATTNLAHACEVFNLARYKVEKRYDRVLKILREQKLKPFIFIFNKN